MHRKRDSQETAIEEKPESGPSAMVYTERAAHAHLNYVKVQKATVKRQNGKQAQMNMETLPYDTTKRIPSELGKLSAPRHKRKEISKRI